MAAPTLKHYSAQTGAINTFVTVVPLVPAGRSLVVSKVAIVAVASGAQFSMTVGPDQGTTRFIVFGMPLATGEQYTETGLVVLAGESLAVAGLGAADAFRINVFGQEVDNV